MQEIQGLSDVDKAFVEQWRKDLRGGNLSASAVKVWLKKEQDLIDRLKKTQPLKEPFDLREGVHVPDPVRFHEALVREADYGPNSPRARMGAIQHDIVEYLAIQKAMKALGL